MLSSGVTKHPMCNLKWWLENFASRGSSLAGQEAWYVEKDLLVM